MKVITLSKDGQKNTSSFTTYCAPLLLFIILNIFLVLQCIAQFLIIALSFFSIIALVFGNEKIFCYVIIVQRVFDDVLFRRFVTSHFYLILVSFSAQKFEDMNLVYSRTLLYFLCI